MTSPRRPVARMAISRATVPLHMAMQCRTPRKAATLAFELLDERAVVREPAAVQHLINARQQPVAVAEVGPADVNGRVEQGRSAHHGKLRKVGLCRRHRLKSNDSIFCRFSICVRHMPIPPLPTARRR